MNDLFSIPGATLTEIPPAARSLVEYTAGYARKRMAALRPDEDIDFCFAFLGPSSIMSIVEAPIVVDGGGIEESEPVQRAFKVACIKARARAAGIVSFAWHVYQPLDGSVPEERDVARFIGTMGKHPDRAEVMHLTLCDGTDPGGHFHTISVTWEIIRFSDRSPKLGRRVILQPHQGQHNVAAIGFIPKYIQSVLTLSRAAGAADTNSQS